MSLQTRTKIESIYFRRITPMSSSNPVFKQFESMNVKSMNVNDIARKFIQNFDDTCRKWLDDPNLQEDDIKKTYQDSQHWVEQIGMYFGTLIGIAKFIGTQRSRQIVVVKEKKKIWNKWLDKLVDLVSGKHFKKTIAEIEKARTRNKYNKTKIGALLGSDNGVFDVFKDKIRKN